MKVGGVDLPGVSRVDVDRWTRAGLLRLDFPGPGRLRHYPAEELRVMRTLDALRRLGGVESLSGACAAGTAAGQQRIRALQVAVAEAARSNPPGTAVDVPSPVPWIRHVVIVPEP